MSAHEEWEATARPDHVLVDLVAGCGETAMPTVSYPPTRTGAVVDDYFGTRVPDPYRWMEELESKDVADWVAAQNV